MSDNSSYILLVEDNPDDVELTKLAFKKNNFANRIEVANDGEEAIQFLFEDHPNGVNKQGAPTFILLDLQLPKIKGHEVLRRIKQHDTMKYVPVIILTSSEQEEDIIKGYDYGANSFIRKPVDFKEFTSVVSNLGIYWMAVNKSIIV
jgi:two-component system response regulator